MLVRLPYFVSVRTQCCVYRASLEPDQRYGTVKSQLLFIFRSIANVSSLLCCSDGGIYEGGAK